MNLTVAYLTMRKDPKFEWFLSGLTEQKKRFPDLQVQLLLIDYWKEEREIGYSTEGIEFHHVLPLPSPWQGKHKVTNQDWFAAANARNTAFVYAIHPVIAFCDDLTVLGENWLQAAAEAMSLSKTVTLGTYTKQHDMVVENGKLISGRLESYGHDPRCSYLSGTGKIKCKGENFFGCSFVLPLEAGLEINGFDCLTDSIGYEDCVFGTRLQNIGYSFLFDKNLSTTESCDHPQTDFQVKRVDKMLGEDLYNQALQRFGCVPTYPKQANKDCSRIIVEVGKQKVKPVWNFFSLRELRAKQERGEEITLSDMNYPLTTWFDGTPLQDDHLITDTR